MALKIARRAHKLHSRRNTDNCGRFFTARGLRAREPVLDSAEARAQLDVAVNQKLKAAGYLAARSTTQAPACTLDLEDEDCEPGCAFMCCVLTCCIPITFARALGMLRDREITTDVFLVAE